MTTTPLSIVTNALGDLMNLETRQRENMPTLLINNGVTIATIKDPRFEGLLGSAASLRSQLDLAVLILDNLPNFSIDTVEMHRVLEESRMEEM